MMRRAVFLDRDGVINRAIVRGGTPHPPAALDDIEILPHVPEALRELRSHGFTLIVVTNQPDVARGTASREMVDAIHDRFKRELELDAIFTCFHDDGDDCGCRKPRPGLLLQGAEKFGIDLPSSFMVGDRWRDVQAGRRAGCRTIFVDHGYPEAPDGHREALGGPGDFRVGSLMEASRIITTQTRPR